MLITVNQSFPGLQIFGENNTWSRAEFDVGVDEMIRGYFTFFFSKCLIIKS